MSHPINPGYIPAGKQVADQLMQTAFGHPTPTPAASGTFRETAHIVELSEGGHIVHHPADDAPCMIDQHIAGVGLPDQPGRYRTKFDLSANRWTWEPIPAPPKADRG